MSLTRLQFEILSVIERGDGEKNITVLTGLPPDSVHNAVIGLTDGGFIENGVLSAIGLRALEPYRVKRAVFLAAGFGSRMAPLTLTTPKPLIRVNGTRIIDTLLDAVNAAEIEEIIIVRGYLGEQFDSLKDKYSRINFLENPYYNEANNISSVLCARDFLQNSYVIESDLLLYNPKLIKKYQYASNYLGVPVKHTDDWCFDTNNGIITRINVGGDDCHHMFGISYWDRADGTKLASHVKHVYESPNGKQRYWDEVALKDYIKDYTVEVRECTFNDITEIDTIDELRRIDESYR